MAKKKEKEPAPLDTGPRRRKSTTLEGRENQLIALAYDAAEKRLLEGTASSQEIVHFLKMGSTREQREARMEEMEIELKAAKKESMETAKRIEELYMEAIKSAQSYTSPALQSIVVSDRHD